MATLVGSTGLVAGRARATDRVGTGPPMAGGIQIARFGTTPGGHLGDQVANHIGRVSAHHRAGHLAVLLRQRSESSRPVDVGAVLDGYHGDQVPLVINTVDHAIIAAASAMKPFKTELQRLADAVRAGG